MSRMELTEMVQVTVPLGLATAEVVYHTSDALSKANRKELAIVALIWAAVPFVTTFTETL